MKASKTLAVALATATALSLAGCGGEDSSKEANTTSTAAATQQEAPLPNAADLSTVLNTAADPEVPLDQKADMVENGDQAKELFDVISKSKQESGADFTVVDPILPGYTPDSVLATVNYTLPDQPPRTVDNVEFVYLDGKWKLSQNWACTLVRNTVPAEQVPPMCQDEGAPAPAGAPAPEGAPAPAAPAPEGAPAQ